MRGRGRRRGGTTSLEYLDGRAERPVQYFTNDLDIDGTYRVAADLQKHRISEVSDDLGQAKQCIVIDDDERIDDTWRARYRRIGMMMWV